MLLINKQFKSSFIRSMSSRLAALQQCDGTVVALWYVICALIVDHFCSKKLCWFVVQQCNKFNNVSPLSPPARDLDLLTKTATKDDIQVNATSEVGNIDVAVDEYSSFMFWRQPLPSLDLEDLTALLPSQGHLTPDDGNDADDGVAADFDEFNYWRVPMPQLEITELLRCLHQL